MVLFEKSYSICQENSDMAKFWPFDQNLAIFWPKLTVLKVFGLLLPNVAMNLPNFWYSYWYGLLWENHTLYRGEILIWRNFGHLRPKFSLLCPKLTVLRVFDLQFPNTAMKLPNFWNGNCSYGLLWKKTYSICRENSDMAKFWPFKTKIRPFFGQNWQFWEFLTFNFQTRLWIFLMFGMEVVLMVLFEKIILYIPGKFWYGKILAI